MQYYVEMPVVGDALVVCWWKWYYYVRYGNHERKQNAL